ncbi:MULTISPECIES: hypothetical protein [Nocardia]|nr:MULTISPECIES: hypothetical protein [Nocardia]
MGAVLGEILAFELAETFDGLVWFFGPEWVSPRERAEVLWIRA